MWLIVKGIQYLTCRRLVIADQDHVASGCQRCGCTIRVIARHSSSRHADIITEDGPLKTQLPTQHIDYPARGITRRFFIHRRIDHMGGHDGRQTGVDQALEGHQIQHRDILISAWIPGYGVM